MFAALGDVGPDGVEATSSDEVSDGTGTLAAPRAPTALAPSTADELVPAFAPWTIPLGSGVRRHPAHRVRLCELEAWREGHVQFAAM